MRKWLLLVVGLWVSRPAYSQQVQYYEINEKPSVSRSVFESPEALTFSSVAPNSVIQTVKVALLNWKAYFTPLANPPQKYSRRTHYGTWVKGIRDGQCYNTRARVLMRDSQAKVEFRDNNNCVVNSGQWYDQFSGQTFYRASEMQIDHVVPVKMSYDLGGWNWSRKKRCMYFNYLSSRDHLIPIGVTENAKKGARGPDQYMPADQKFWCGYIRHWLRVKAVWALPLTTSEGEAVAQVIKQAQCSSDLFKMSETELAKLRSQIHDQAHSCNQLEERTFARPHQTEIEDDETDSPELE